MKEVTATIENTRMMPTHSSNNLKFRIDPPDYICLDGGTIVAGMIVKDKDNNINLEQKKNPGRLEVRNIPGYSHIDVKWIVKGGRTFTVRAESVKGGWVSAKIE